MNTPTKYTTFDDALSEKKPIQPAEEKHDLLQRKLAMVSEFPKRYIVAFMAMLGFCNIYALRVNLSVALVAMTMDRKIMNVTSGELQNIGPEFHYKTRQTGIILGSFFYGYIFTQLPGGFLSGRLGGKYLFGGGVVITSVLTLFTPLCTSLPALVALRVIEGLCEGVTYPSIHAIWSHWAPPAERTKLGTFAFAGSYIGTVIAMPISGALATSSLGWPAIFYFFGVIGILWFVGWCYLVPETPAKHNTISKAELEYIQTAIGFTDEQAHNSPTPWVQMLLSPAVWAIVMAHFAENWGFYTWLTELPSFMKFALGFNMQNSGFLSALPYLMMGVVVLGSGCLADHLRSKVQVETSVVRKLFTCGAFICQVVFMVAAGYSQTPVAAITCLTIAVGLGGFAWAGFSVNHLDIAPQYASILMGLSNTFATIPGIVSPALTGVIVTDKTNSGEWQIIFYLAAGVYLLGAVIYGIFASGERQKWAEIQTGYLSHEDFDKDL